MRPPAASPLSGLRWARHLLPFALRLAVFGCLAGASALAEEPAPNAKIDTFLNALDEAISRPGETRDALLKAVEAAEAERATREADLEAAKARIARLHRALEIFGPLADPAQPAPVSAPAAPPAPAAESMPAASTSTHPASEPPPTTNAAFDEAARTRFAQRFEGEIWPLLQKGESNCFDCHHGSSAKNPLTFTNDPAESFLRLLREGYFDAENPVSLIARVSSPNTAERMPPSPRPALADPDVAALRKFVVELHDAQSGQTADTPHDEQFPMELAQPWVDVPELKAELVSTTATTRRADPQGGAVLTYYQIRRKVRAVFGEEWARNEHDLFAENIAQLGGADFERYFNESARPTSSYLAALDQMAGDLASRAYLNLTGPFAGMGEPPPAPDTAEPPGEPTRAAIAHLYRKMLMRAPTEPEIAGAARFLREAAEGVRAEPPPAAEALDFELTVTGEAGVPTVRQLAFEVRNDPHTLYQDFINEEQKSPMMLRRKIGESFELRPDDAGAWFVIGNAGTLGSVIIAGVDLVGPLPDRTVTSIPATDPGVRMRGPWEIQPRGPVKVLNDRNQGKGDCEARIPLRVTKPGQYEVHAKWMSAPGKQAGAPEIPIEVVAWGASRCAGPTTAPRPPVGEARFFIDETIDTIAHVDLKTQFRFETEDHYVEINNKGTDKRVAADAIRFLPAKGAPILIDDGDAVGHEAWTPYKDFPFRPYNIIGECLSDANAKKGELTLRYTPARKGPPWTKDTFYGVQIVYPGQDNHETRVPIIVRAAASSPIIQISAPTHAHAGAEVALDASATYDTQGSALKFEWKQTGGPHAAIADPHAAKAVFTAPSADPTQRAWEGLVRALTLHPDFIFTRPPTLARLKHEDEGRARLLLTRLAQDLAARPPTDEEFARLAAGESIESMIDGYLATDDFRDFYMRRIRLYLESHGGEEQDEAVRLWCHVAFNKRPFQEILTADYTVNAKMERQDRPVYFGRTGLLAMKGFIDGKPGLPHFNYAAQVAEKFLGYVFEVPPEIVQQREGLTAVSTTNPGTVCYSCHKVLTPLAFQRMHWDDRGNFRTHDERGLAIDASDQALVPSYPFRGEGLEAFATQAAKKERFIRTIIDTHFTFYMGRAMRWETDERVLYRKLWDKVSADAFTIPGLIKAILMTDEYQGREPEPATSENVQVAGAAVGGGGER